MKHQFKVGDGMSTENSTAEERKEIHQLLEDNGYPVYVKTKDKTDYQWSNGLTVANDGDWISGNISLTNPLTYSQMKALILGEKWNFIDAVCAVRDGSHQIEKDCDNLDLLRDVLKEAFPDQCILEDKLQHLTYFRVHLNVAGEFDNHAGTNYNNSDANLPIIKLSEIMPKEVKLIELSEVVEQLQSAFNELQKASDKIYELNKLRLNEVTKEYLSTAEFLFGKYTPEMTDKINSIVDKLKKEGVKNIEKPVELEAGKWYVGIKPDGSKSGYIAFYETVPNRPKKKGVCYGFYKSVWFDRQKRYANYLRPATTSEITEAIKAEAIKRGLDKGYHEWDGESYIGVRKSSPEMYLNEEMDCLVYSESLNHVFNKGVWAQPITTITRKEAEEKLNAKIVD